MYETKAIPNTFLENTKIVNEATNFFKSNKDISEINTLYNKNINYFSFNKNDNSNNNFQSNTLNKNKNSIETNKLNKQKKFGWKNIMNLNYDLINKEENILNNPLIENILNSDINENEIQNIPENYLVNLIHTLQGLANEAIKNKNDLEIENKKLNQDLEEMKTNNEYLNQNNIKMNQKLLNLNKYNNSNNNYIYNIFNQNNPYININSIYKKKYYCYICTNKKFKSQFYLDEHIKRRHPDYQEKIQTKKNYKNKDKENKEFLQNKLNQINKYFDYLINKFIKKIQYIKINEKLNSLQNVYDMIQLNKDVKITNINKTNISKEKHIINKTITKINMNKESENEIENENENDNDDNIINDTIENSFQKKHEEELKKLSKTKDLMEKKHGNFIYQYWLTKKEIQFATIKNNFAINPEEEEEQSNHQRRRKKLQTLKVKSKLVEMNKLEDKKNDDSKKTIEINEENNIKQKTDDDNQEKNILKQNKENIIDKNNDNDNNNNINIIINDEMNTNNTKDKKDILYSNTKKEEETIKSTKQKFNLKSEKMINFSDEEEEEDKEFQTLKKFCKDFREREFKISSDHKYHKKTVAPDDYIRDNQDQINDALDAKINKKMKKINFEGKSNKEMKADMMQIYYATIDTNYLYGDRYLYTYMNIGNFVNIKDIISDAYNTNFYAEDSFFEKVKYNIQNNPDNSEENISANDQFINVSFGNIKAN